MQQHPNPGNSFRGPSGTAHPPAIKWKQKSFSSKRVLGVLSIGQQYPLPPLPPLPYVYSSLPTFILPAGQSDRISSKSCVLVWHTSQARLHQFTIRKSTNISSIYCIHSATTLSPRRVCASHGPECHGRIVKNAYNTSSTRSYPLIHSSLCTSTRMTRKANSHKTGGKRYRERNNNDFGFTVSRSAPVVPR